MTEQEWLGLRLGVAVTLGVLALARIAFRGGYLQQTQRWRFLCPGRRGLVECRLVQDIRTGQWTAVRSCSALPGLACRQECLRLLNLGLPVRQAARGRRAPHRG